MASRNGLNPQIRGPKGIGFGRALPSPFGFGNGFLGDGTDDYFTVPRLVGVSMPLEFTVEFWIKLNATFLDNYDAAGGYFSMQDIALKTFYLNVGNSSQKGFLIGTPLGGAGNPRDQLVLDSKNHVVVTFDFINNSVTETINGNLSTMRRETAGGYTQQPINEVAIYRNILNYCGTLPIDEFRIYSRIISDIEITTNYNNGIGLNASISEGLLLWYKFEEFENLDFSVLQDGSDMRTGIRDLSGKNNHAYPQGGIVTNPASPTYTLNTF